MREIQGKQIIENLGVDKTVQVVVDPTMLLTKKIGMRLSLQQGLSMANISSAIFGE